MILPALALSLFSVHAQTGNNLPVFKGTTWGAKIWYFPINRTELQRDHYGNALMFSALDSLLRIRRVVENIDTVYITAAASPIARAEYNRKLSVKRGEAMRDYITGRYGIGMNRFNIKPIGVDWEGFCAIMEKDSAFPYRQDILALANGTHNEDGKLWLLRSMGDPSTQQRLIGEIYPLLQYVSVRLLLKDGNYIPQPDGSPLKQLLEEGGEDRSVPPGIPAAPVIIRDTLYLENLVRDTVYISRYDTVYMEKETGKPPVYPDHRDGVDFSVLPKIQKSLYMVIKNNLLYDAALTPNLTAEIYLGKNWSVAAEGNWSWWSKPSPDPNRWYHRIQAAGVELRRWIKPQRPLQGHAFGIYALGGTYDIRLFVKDENTKGWLSNWSWSAGVGYGYSFPVSKRLSVELGVSAGYLTGTYYENDWCTELNEGSRRAEKIRRYWGPTRIGCSLAWRLFD
jgi:hypothetical protein